MCKSGRAVAVRLNVAKPMKQSSYADVYYNIYVYIIIL